MTWRLLFFLLIMFFTASTAHAYEGVFALTGSESYLTQIIGQSNRSGGFSIGARGGIRSGHWGGFMELQYVGWNGYDTSDHQMQKSLNFGLGAEVLYFDRRVRTAMSLGGAILATKSQPDSPGEFGVYVDMIPASVILKPTERLNILITPLSLFVNVPSLKGIPLLVIQYRTTLAIEFSL